MKKLLLFLCFALLISYISFAQLGTNISGNLNIGCGFGANNASWSFNMPYDGFITASMGSITVQGSFCDQNGNCGVAGTINVDLSLEAIAHFTDENGLPVSQNIGFQAANPPLVALYTETNSVRAGTLVEIKYSINTISTACAQTQYGILINAIPFTYNADSEPNDDYTEAITTTENTFYEGHGSMFVPSYNEGINWREDWYKIVIPRNGVLNVSANSDTTTSLSDTALQSQYATSAIVYRSNSDGSLGTGISQFNTSNGANGSFSFSEYCVQENDVLYLRFSGDSNSYQFSWNVQEPTGFIDAEPNNTNLEAIVINDGETKTGNVGNGLTTIINVGITTEDIEDWYKFTLPTAGDVSIDITANNLAPIAPSYYQFIFKELPDGSLSSSLSGNQISGNQTNGFIASCLAAGTYYIRINDNADASAGAVNGHCLECCVTYALTVNFNNAATFQADAEPNNSFTDALFVSPNVDNDGQISYFSENGVDNIDVYELVMNFNGDLSINFTEPLPQNAADLFSDSQQPAGTINLDANNMITSISYACAAEGESYFLRVLSNTCMSYQFNYTNTMIDVNNELEPNNNVANSQQINEFDLLFGQVGYGNPQNRDLSDNYELLALTSAPLTYNFDLNGDMTVELIRFDTFVVTSVTQDQNSGNINSISFNNIDANNTYYLRLKSTDCTDYWLNGWTQGFTGTNDSEPNNDVANTIPINFAQNYQGRLSFLNSGSDTVDYYSFTLPLADDVQFILNAFEGLVSTATLTLFNINGTQVFQLAHDGTNTARVLNILNLTAGDYYFTITGTTETGSYEVKVTPQTTLSITDNSLDNLVVLYPNPAKDKINISLSNTLNIATTNVYDVTGKLILSKNLNNAESQMDVSQLQTGIYFIKIETENASITKRFIKQ